MSDGDRNGYVRQVLRLSLIFLRQNIGCASFVEPYMSYPSVTTTTVSGRFTRPRLQLARSTEIKLSGRPALTEYCSPGANAAHAAHSKNLASGAQTLMPRISWRVGPESSNNNSTSLGPESSIGLSRVLSNFHQRGRRLTLNALPG